jgi:hypothetical protein
MEEVVGSIPTRSTNLRSADPAFLFTRGNGSRALTTQQPLFNFNHESSIPQSQTWRLTTLLSSFSDARLIDAHGETDE